MHDVSAVILAGGLGNRLRPLVADRNKVVAQIHNRPFLAYLLDQVARAGVGQAVICTGYRGEQVREVLGDHYHGLPLIYSQEAAPLGTAGALRLALPQIANWPALVMNGDSFCDADMAALYRQHIARQAVGTLALTQVSDTRRYGQVLFNEADQILQFAEKSESGGAGWINAGIYLLNREIVESILPGVAVSIEHKVFPQWVSRGLYGYKSTGRFLDIGTPESYKAAEIFFAAERTER